LDRLPLAHCFEIHLSGCEIVGEKFVDAHHGVLLEQQLRMLQMILPLCPSLRAVTFEDPRVNDAGALIETSEASWRRIEEVTRVWARTAI
jgi:hypothetical protein